MYPHVYIHMCISYVPYCTVFYRMYRSHSIYIILQEKTTCTAGLPSCFENALASGET